MRAEYDLILKQAQTLTSDEDDLIATTANLSALLFHSLERINWLGFYFQRGDELVLGPFQGKVACTRISIGKGVCGIAFEKQETLIVDDVHLFEGHIACDSASESEIVVPFVHSKVAGVLDVDSPEKSRFSAEESELLNAIVALIG